MNSLSPSDGPHPAARIVGSLHKAQSESSIGRLRKLKAVLSSFVTTTVEVSIQECLPIKRIQFGQPTELLDGMGPIG